MAQAKGSKGQLLGAVKEATYNTTPGTPSMVNLPFNSCNLRPSQNMITPATITSARSQVAPALGNIDLAGQVVVPVDVLAMGYWLQMLLGDPTADTDNGDGTYSHVFKVPDSIDSWIMELGFTDIGEYWLYNGCKANQMTLQLGGDNELTATIDVIGGKATRGASSQDASPTSVALTRFNNFQLVVKEGGSASTQLIGCSLAINNNLDTSVYLIGGSGYRGSLPEGMVNVSGSLTAIYEDNTLFAKALAGTESSLQFTFTNGDNVLDILLDECLYSMTGPAIETPAGVQISLNFQAYYANGANSSACVITLTNTQAAYIAA